MDALRFLPLGFVAAAILLAALGITVYQIVSHFLRDSRTFTDDQ